MCQKSPFPRCSSHARKSLHEAMQSGDKAAIRKAKNEYLETPEGIQKLKDEGKHELAQRFSDQRQRKIEKAKKFFAEEERVQQNDLTNLSITEDERKVLDEVHKFYDTHQGNLMETYATGEGATRAASGSMFEKMIDIVVTMSGPRYEGRVGTKDYQEAKYEHFDGTTVSVANLQVDRHVYRDGKPHAFIESKVYLDKCYLERAVSDLLELNRSLKSRNIDTKDVEYIVFAGQDALSDKSRKLFEAKFWNESAEYVNKRAKIKIFMVSEGKRNSKSPLHAKKHALVDAELVRFMRLLNK